MCKLKLTKMDSEIRIENRFTVLASVMGCDIFFQQSPVMLSEVKQIVTVAENFDMIFNSLKEE